MVAAFAANQALDVAVASELGSLLHAHVQFSDPRWRLEAVVRVRALARRFDVDAPRLDRELADGIARAPCPPALRVPLGALAGDRNGDVAARAVTALYEASWIGAAMHGFAAALMAGNRGAAVALQTRVLAATSRRLPHVDELIEWGGLRRGWSELAASLASAGSEDEYRPSARLVAGLVDEVCASGDRTRVTAAERLVVRVPAAERAIARAHVARLALRFGGNAAGLRAARGIREDNVRAGALFMLALVEPSLADAIEAKLLRQRAYCENAREHILAGRVHEGLRLLRRVDDPRCRAHRRLVHDELRPTWIPAHEREVAFEPAPWTADRIIDGRTRREITFAIVFTREGLADTHPSLISDAARSAARLLSPITRGAYFAGLEREGVNMEAALLRMRAEWPDRMGGTLVAHLARRIARITRNAPAIGLPRRLPVAPTPLERALFDEGLSLSSAAPQRRRVLIDVSRASIRAALRAPASAPSDIVDARLRTLVHLGGEIPRDAILNAVEQAPTVGEHTERAIDALCELDAARAADLIVERAPTLRARCNIGRLLQTAEVRGGLPHRFAEHYRRALDSLARLLPASDRHAWLAGFDRAWRTRQKRRPDTRALMWITRQLTLPENPDDLVMRLEAPRHGASTHSALAEHALADPAWLDLELLSSPPRLDPRMPAWTDERWRKQLTLARDAPRINLALVERCAALLGRRRAVSDLLVGNLEALGVGPLATFTADASYRVRLLDKRTDLLTYLRFADLPVRSCYRSDSGMYSHWDGTEVHLIAGWKDPLTFCFHIEREHEGTFTACGFFFGSFADLGGRAAVTMNSLHVRPGSPAVRLAVIDYLEKSVCAPLGIRAIGIGNMHNGRGALPDRYQPRKVTLTRLCALTGHREPIDDIGWKLNALTDVERLHWAM